MSNSVRPHRWQPTRLCHPWDSPRKNTGVGCHFLLQCIKVKRESEVTQSCLTPSDPMDCSPPGSSIHGVLQARVLEWVAIATQTQKIHDYYKSKWLLSSYFLRMIVGIVLTPKLIGWYFRIVNWKPSELAKWGAGVNKLTFRLSPSNLNSPNIWL